MLGQNRIILMTIDKATDQLLDWSLTIIHKQAYLVHCIVKRGTICWIMNLCPRDVRPKDRHQCHLHALYSLHADMFGKHTSHYLIFYFSILNTEKARVVKGIPHGNQTGTCASDVINTKAAAATVSTSLSQSSFDLNTRRIFESNSNMSVFLCIVTRWLIGTNYLTQS